jgi:hypothetical protein
VVVKVEAVGEAHTGPLPGVLAQVHVVPVGRAPEQVHDANRVGGLPGVLDRDVGNEAAYLVLERQLAGLDELQLVE